MKSPHPKLPMKRVEFICLSAFTMMLTALGIDIMLPALSELRHHFGLRADSTATANIIMFFFMGQVVQLVFGILSDSFGRLPVFRIGFPLYIIGGVAAAFSPTLELMCAARFVAGMGASAVLTTTIAGVRDRFAGDEMARMMSFIFTIFLFTPVMAPFLGMAILSFGSWKAVFLTPPVFAVIVFLWSLRLNESHPAERRAPLSWASARNSLILIFKNRTFLRYTTITTLLFSALSVYVSGSERIVGEIYGHPELFASIFAAIGLVMSFAALYNARLSKRYGAKRTIRSLLFVYAGVSIILLLITIVEGGKPEMFAFFTCVGILMAINLAIEPNSSALALEPMGENAGIAASVYGTIFFFVGSAIGSVISELMQHYVMPFVISFILLGGISIWLALTDKKQ